MQQNTAHKNTNHAYRSNTDLVKSSWETQQSAKCCEPPRISLNDILGFDLKFCTLFESFGLLLTKRVFKLNCLGEISDYDNSPSRTEPLKSVCNAEDATVFMFLCQTERFLPSQEANSPLFSLHILIG